MEDTGLDLGRSTEMFVRFPSSCELLCLLQDVSLAWMNRSSLVELRHGEKSVCYARSWSEGCVYWAGFYNWIILRELPDDEFRLLYSDISHSTLTGVREKTWEWRSWWAHQRGFVFINDAQANHFHPIKGKEFFFLIRWNEHVCNNSIVIVMLIMLVVIKHH